MLLRRWRPSSSGSCASPRSRDGRRRTAASPQVDDGRHHRGLSTAVALEFQHGLGDFAAFGCSRSRRDGEHFFHILIVTPVLVAWLHEPRTEAITGTLNETELTPSVPVLPAVMS